MKRLGPIAAFLTFAGCAHLPPNLPEWSAEKAIRLAECGALGLQARDDAVKCLGRFAQSAGTEACKAADQWLSNYPVEPEEGRDNAN